jgi:hypothetical protein
MDTDAPNQDPSVQGQQGQAETAESVAPVAPAVETAAQPNEGFQRRIDELTRARREAERLAEERQQQLLAVLERVASQAPVPPAPVKEADPFEDLNPEDRVRLQKAFDARLAPLQRQLEETNQFIRSQQATQQVQAQAAQEPPEVVQRAQQLMQAWSAKGKTGWEPIDAVRYAKVMLMEEGKYVPPAPATQPRASNGQYMSSASQVTSASPTPAPAPRKKGLPADLENRPLEEQIKIMEEAGIGDMPL